MQRLTLAALGLLAAIPAWAGPYEDTEYVTCRDKPTVDAVDCLKHYTAEWDKQLNQAYTAAMAHQSPEQKSRLQEVQLLWVKYRDANCDFYYQGQGSIRQLQTAECLRSMTQQRALELKSLGPR